MRPLRNRKGVVLILVLSMVALFTAMIVAFSADESLDIELAYNFRDSVQAQYIARGGVEAALAILSEDDAGHDSLDEQWAQFAEYAASASAYLEGAQLSGGISDESGRIDLNSLAKNDGNREFRVEQFKRLFTLLRIDINDDELNDLVNAIIDWIDADSETELGAEDEYYQTLEPPYHCKNAPLDSIEELLLIKGMKREFLTGTENYEGIRNFVTVGTDGKININTASETVLQTLSDEIGEDVVSSILDCRPFQSADYGCVRGLDLAGGTPESTWIRNTLEVKSRRFAVEVKSVMPSGAQVNVRAELERINNKPRIVYYRIH
ncbi:MAG TPA: type II secretion system minor pseudopilin GspK [Desulfomonilia bacterium]|nr:type II secretion system minor pseudopilin GspK [Desulfomonilia bacterium]